MGFTSNGAKFGRPILEILPASPTVKFEYPQPKPGTLGEFITDNDVVFLAM
jgi:hypothetical protein